MKDSELFDKRPTRTKQCPRCRGCGEIVDAYALAHGFVEAAPADAVQTVVIGSFDIFTATKEARDIAKVAQRPVAFDFNGKLVIVRADDDPNQVARDWWQRMHGETPEATTARR